MDNEKLITNVHDTNMLKQQLAGYLLNQAQKGGKVLDSTDNYQLMRSQDPWNQSEYIEMWGQLDDNVNFLIRSPVESIRESVALSNRFLIYVGMGTLIICMGLVWYFSRRITKPIQELAEPVSYTHLDVYKRQSLCISGPMKCVRKRFRNYLEK